MKYQTAIVASILLVCIVIAQSTPLYEYEEVPTAFEQETLERERRSPRKGQFEIDVKDDRDDFGNRDKHVEGKYTQRWGREDGPRAEVEAHYRRNFGHDQPREQHGVQGKIIIPFGDD